MTVATSEFEILELSILQWLVSPVAASQMHEDLLEAFSSFFMTDDYASIQLQTAVLQTADLTDSQLFAMQVLSDATAFDHETSSFQLLCEQFQQKELAEEAAWQEEVFRNTETLSTVYRLFSGEPENPIPEKILRSSMFFTILFLKNPELIFGLQTAITSNVAQRACLLGLLRSCYLTQTFQPLHVFRTSEERFTLTQVDLLRCFCIFFRAEQAQPQTLSRFCLNFLNEFRTLDCSSSLSMDAYEILETNFILLAQNTVAAASDEFIPEPNIQLTSAEVCIALGTEPGARLLERRLRSLQPLVLSHPSSHRVRWLIQTLLASCCLRTPTDAVRVAACFQLLPLTEQDFFWMLFTTLETATLAQIFTETFSREMLQNPTKIQKLSQASDQVGELAVSEALLKALQKVDASQQLLELLNPSSKHDPRKFLLSFGIQLTADPLQAFETVFGTANPISEHAQALSKTKQTPLKDIFVSYFFKSLQTFREMMLVCDLLEDGADQTVIRELLQQERYLKICQTAPEEFRAVLVDLHLLTEA